MTLPSNTAATAAENFLHEKGVTPLTRILSLVHGTVGADAAALGDHKRAIPSQIHLAVNDRVLTWGSVPAGLHKGEALSAEDVVQLVWREFMRAANVVEHEQGVDGKWLGQLAGADVCNAAETIVLWTC